VQPLWEIGVAAAAGVVPDYPASDHYSPQAIPFPYFAFRGRVFRSDQNGARLRADVRSNVEVDVSGGAAFAAQSNSSSARAGMPNLDYLLELGPNLKITLDRPSPESRWLVELPLRVVASFYSLHAGYQGLVFTPDVGFHTRSLLGSRWNAYADIGPSFASARYQQYFYQVEAQYALPDRPEYLAHGGYFGSTLEMGVGHKLGKDLRVFFYGRVDDYAGARSEDSPLFKTTLGYSAFAGFSWSIWHSKDTVTMVEEAP
jgi:MipA family protein